MRVGIVILADQPWSVARRRWQAAEAYGFDHAWTYDHIGWRSLVDGPWFDAVPTLAAAALATTKRIRLGTMVASPNFRHPVHFAREVTALDDLAGGRLVLGIGAGGTGFDQAVLGRPALTAGQRTDRFEEFVELLDRVLRAPGPVSYQGRHYTAVEARGLPGCVTKPRIPFVVAANGPRAAAVAARYGQGWVTSGGPADGEKAWWRLVADARQGLDEALARGRPGTVLCGPVPGRWTPADRSTRCPAWTRSPTRSAGRPGSGSPTSSPTGRARRAGSPATRRCWRRSRPRSCPRTDGRR